MPGRNPEPSGLSVYNKTYEMWKATWEEAAKDVPALPSNRDGTEFLRQDKVLSVFYNGNPTGCGFWTELDFSTSIAREDFYFRNWTDKGIEGLLRDGPWIGMYSYLTVAKAFRKGNPQDLSFKDIQIAIFVKYFLHSSMDAMTGCTRNNRGVNSVCSRGGAVPLDEGLMQYDCSTDLMAWFHDSAKIPLGYEKLADHLWTNRVEIEQTKPSFNMRNATDKFQIENNLTV